MAVLPIVITGESVLHSRAEPVTVFDRSLQTLIDDMIETMHAAPGVGLAAPQVGVGLRLFVYEWSDEGTTWSGVAINPELWLSPTAIGEADDETESEGCLSIPGERFPLRRADRAILRALDRDGEEFEIQAEGWLARIFQHEYDHLDGTLYADRLEYAHAKACAKIVRKRGWGISGKTWIPGIDDLEGD